MPNPLLLSAGLNLGGMALNNIFPKWFGGQTDFKMLNPAQYKNQIVLDDGDIGGIRSNLTNQATDANALNAARIKQTGAANRLPEGATQSALAGASHNLAKGVASVEPQLQNMKRQSLLDYLNLQMMHDGRKLAHETGNANQSASFNQGALGSLSQLGLLWSAGLFNKDNPSGNQPGNPLPGLGFDPSLMLYGNDPSRSRMG